MAEKTIENGEETPGLQGLYTSFRANTPWLYLDIDRTQAKTHGVPMSEIFNTLQVYLGSLYVNDFNRFGRTWQVNVQAAAEFRTQIDDLKQIKVPNIYGKMVPLAALAQGPPRERPGADHALQHVSVGGHQRQSVAAASAPDRPSS